MGKFGSEINYFVGKRVSSEGKKGTKVVESCPLLDSAALAGSSVLCSRG